jgi:hypothetical protein
MFVPELQLSTSADPSRVHPKLNSIYEGTRFQKYLIVVGFSWTKTISIGAFSRSRDLANQLKVASFLSMQYREDTDLFVTFRNVLRKTNHRLWETAKSRGFLPCVPYVG